MISAAALVLALAAPGPAPTPRTVVLWHSYDKGEADALQQIVTKFNAEHPLVHVEALQEPYEIMASKLSTAIPQGNGPDLFIFAHERIGGWADEGIVAPLDGTVGDAEWKAFLPETLAPLDYGGHRYGLPLAFKTMALYYNEDLVPDPPRTTDDLLAMGARLSGGGRFALAYPTDDGFYFSAWYFGFGATLFDEQGRLLFETPQAIASLDFVRKLRDGGMVPEEVTAATVDTLFNGGKAAMVVSQPWFVSHIDPKVRWGVTTLPVVSSTGLPAKPFLTDEAVMISARAADPEDALAVARAIAGPDGALVRALVGRQMIATAATWSDPRLAADPVLAAFKAQLPATVPTDNRPIMRSYWEPAQLALRKVLRGDATPAQAARAAVRRQRANTRPPSPPADPRPYVVLASALVLAGLALGFRNARSLDRRSLGEAARAWTWVGPAALATGILIFVPFAVGLALSLFEHHEGAWSFVGIANFTDILASRTYGPMEPLSFYYALAVTILWTVVNLALHVSLGLALALLLNRPLLKLKPVYRVLLIVPWAVPNYITALLWKGLFHKQFGAINGLLALFGIHGIAWFSSFWTAFFANVCTNAWLGFPFMMVVSLGALQSIPKDLYEAAAVDGAGAFARFRHVTAPLLLPALVPAVLLGTVWTFNQFNIVYLVSGGEPDNSTDILISEAWRWAFARQEQYGYAAAYAALIFVVLLLWSLASTRVARVAEAMR